MATPVRLTGFEHGTATPVTNGGGIANTVNGTPTVVSTPVNPGSYSLEINPSAATEYISWDNMLTAAWLGMGTVHLLIRKGNTAMILTWILLAVSILAFLLVMFAPVTSTVYDVTQPASGQYKEILARSGWIIFLNILLNLYGTLTLVGGALYSAFLFWRKKILINRMFGNILIALGALSPALRGTAVRIGYVDLLYLSELVGAVVMFFGFLLATSSAPATSTVVARS